MRKKDADRNMLWGWGLVGLALLFTVVAIGYTYAVQAWFVQGILNP